MAKHGRGTEAQARFVAAHPFAQAAGKDADFDQEIVKTLKSETVNTFNRVPF